MKRITLTIVVALIAIFASAASKNYVVTSPDGTLVASVSAGGKLSWSLTKDGKTVLEPSLISMTLADGSVYGAPQKVKKVVRSSVDQMLPNPLYKKSQVRENYNEMTLNFNDFALVVRVFDEGAAYRFVSKSKKDFTVVSEQAEFTFPEDAKVTVPYVSQHTGTLENQLFNSFESYYDQCRISGLREDRIAFAPVNVRLNDFSVNITESDLKNYPGMFLYKGVATGDGSMPVGPATVPNSLKGVWAPLPDKTYQAGHNMLQRLVESRQGCIAKLSAGEATPWRIVAVAREDAQLLDSDIVWLLGAPSQGDFSWVKVGKVAWDWWNDWNITGVDFKAGVNNDTYKYYIDFASAHGIEYVILDEGWAVNKEADLFQVIPEINLQELVDYGKSKNVGIILWAGYWAFNRDMEKVCREYSKMGVKGFKVDFLDHDDQDMVAFTSRAAQICAEYKMMIDLHGMFKPAGLNRTWPNVIGYEGVKGLENMKWSKMKDFDCVT
ncbi:MAG: glycoside hydrolase family 97 catalytic domain-containing protein, partial [Bacteroidales bacterium]|nr:glycoside hydrolase family 97 catalytic domain-containing protein [Bacteroidales bacterium]